MSGCSAIKERCPEEIHVLVFNIMGVRMGVDVDQVAEMTDVETARSRKLPVHHLPDRLSFGEKSVRYRTPIAVMIKGVKISSFVVIDAPEDIAIISVRSIRPIPRLIAQRSGSGAIWGAVIRNEQVVFLLDFQKLFSEGTPHKGAIGKSTDFFNEGGKL